MRRVIILALVALAAITTSAQFTDVPAYHPKPPRKAVKLPHILSGRELSGPAFRYPFQVRAYELAAKIPRVVYQQPCYCRCDRSVGHTSLHSCYESTHAAVCSACLKELFYAWDQHKKGKSAAQIRQGIIEHAWERVDLRTVAAAH